MVPSRGASFSCLPASPAFLEGPGLHAGDMIAARLPLEDPELQQLWRRIAEHRDAGQGRFYALLALHETVVTP